MDFAGNKPVAVILYWMSMEKVFLYHYKMIHHYHSESCEIELRPKQNMPKDADIVEVSEKRMEGF